MLAEEVKPKLNIIAACKNQKILFFGHELQSKTVALIAVATDITCMIIFILYIQMLIVMQRDYVKQFDEQAIEMRNFAIKINKLPESFRQYQDELSMKMEIWMQIQDKIKYAQKLDIIDNNIDTTIVNIAFGLRKYDLLNRLVDLDKLSSNIEELNIKYENEKDPRIMWRIQ